MASGSLICYKKEEIHLLPVFVWAHVVDGGQTAGVNSPNRFIPGIKLKLLGLVASAFTRPQSQMCSLIPPRLEHQRLRSRPWEESVSVKGKALALLHNASSSLCRKLLPLEEFTFGMMCRGTLASKDADPLSQPLHLVVLRQTGATQVPFCWRPMALCHKLIPACIVALMGDISLAHLSL